MPWMIVSEDSADGPRLRADAALMAAHWDYELSIKDRILAAGSLPRPSLTPTRQHKRACVERSPFTAGTWPFWMGSFKTDAGACQVHNPTANAYEMFVCLLIEN